MLIKKKPYKQSGKTNISKDKRLKAMPVGWRISRNGNLYFENRRNRTDISQDKGL